MSRLLLRGAAVLDGMLVPDALVACEDDEVVWSGPQAASTLEGWPQPQHLPDEHTLLPGLVDLHCHGAVGVDFAATGSPADPDAQGAARAAAFHRTHGTTSLVASIVTGSDADTRRAINALSPLVDDGLLAGLHLEGPYLSPARRGAHDPALLRAPDLAELQGWLDLADGRIVHVTIAPELPGASAAADRVRDTGAFAAVGHSDADQQTVADALAADDRTGLVTHLFNAMRPLHHREPGPVSAALSAAARGHAVLELIADGVHLDDGLVGTVLRLVGPRQVALVTDAMSAAGVGDGDYELGGLRVRVVRGVARLASDTGDGLGDGADGAIAGGTACLIDVVRRCTTSSVADLDLADVVTAATATPARVLAAARQHTAGAPLSPGTVADLLVVDADLRPVRVAVRGQWLDGAS